LDLLNPSHDIIDRSHQDAKPIPFLQRQDAGTTRREKDIFNLASRSNQFGNDSAFPSFFTLYSSPKIHEGFLCTIFFHIASHVTTFHPVFRQVLARQGSSRVEIAPDSCLCCFSRPHDCESPIMPSGESVENPPDC
jgi:hypothetical protein